MRPIEQILETSELSLVETPRGLALSDGTCELFVDYTKFLRRTSPARPGKELLVKAAKVKHPDGSAPKLVDATAGLGEDAFLLAASGFDVTLYENNPVVFLLLKDAHERACAFPSLEKIAERMHLENEDSIEAMERLADGTDVIYLDPMFPARTKSAAVKKKFQLMHRLYDSSDDAEALLESALKVHPKKIVIKRPLKGPFVLDRAPSYSLRGKAIRYDVIV